MSELMTNEDVLSFWSGRVGFPVDQVVRRVTTWRFDLRADVG